MITHLRDGSLGSERQGGCHPMQIWNDHRLWRLSTTRRVENWLRNVPVDYDPKISRKKLGTLWWTNILPWKITIFNGKIHYFDWAIFNSFLYVHQRVHGESLVIHNLNSHLVVFSPLSRWALWKMMESVGMMTFPTEWKVIKFMFQITNQIKWTSDELQVPWQTLTLLRMVLSSLMDFDLKCITRRWRYLIPGSSFICFCCLRKRTVFIRLVPLFWLRHFFDVFYFSVLDGLYIRPSSWTNTIIWRYLQAI